MRARVCTWLECERCKKWRIVPEAYAAGVSDRWYCEMNIDPGHNRCDVPQEPDDATGDQFTDQHVAKKARPSMWARLTSFTSWLIGHGPGA